MSDLMTSELKHTLQMARAEINQLRRINEVLRAKVDTMELFALVFRTMPNYGSAGMAEDPVWHIERELDRLDAKGEGTS